MDEPPDLEARVTALEGRIEEVAADASAARHLAAASDRDLADLGVKVDANRVAINALGLQLGGRLTGVENRLGGVENRLGGVENRLGGVEARLGGVEGRLDGLETRFDGLETRFDGLEVRFDGLERRVDRGFAEARGMFDAAAAGQQTIVDLLTRLIDEPEPPASR